MDGPFALHLLCLLATLLNAATVESAGIEVEDAALDKISIIARNGLKEVEWGIKTSGSQKPVKSSCQDMKCKAGERCMMVNDKPKCVCNSVCPANSQPVCGTDGKTYPNMCWLNIQTCKSKGKVRLKHSGKCVLSSPRNCAEVLKRGGRKSGVYTIDPDGKGSFQVYCNQSIAGGGWTVFQRRQDGSVNFWRNWKDYKTGFGKLYGEFWLGLDKIHRLAQQSKNIIRIDLVYITNRKVFAQYDSFGVSSERTRYVLSLGNHSGTGQDALTYHSGQPFSTRDWDNDDCGHCNCAIEYKAGWWYKQCHQSNLNGLYDLSSNTYRVGVKWGGYKAKWSEMKILPA